MGTIAIKQSDDTISILKGIGIILVVVGHSSPPSYVFNFIYLFHVSLFFISSGYFFNDKNADNKINYIWKRIKGLYIPFVKYSIAFILLHNFFYYLNIYNSEYGYNDSVNRLYEGSDYLNNIKLVCFHFSESEMLLGALWFLESLFVSSIIFLFIFWGSRFFSEKKSIVPLTILVLCFYIAGFIIDYYNLKLPLGINREFILVSLIYLGYVYKKYLGDVPTNIFVTIFSIIFLLIAMNYFSISIVMFNFSSPYVFLFLSMAGFYMILSFSRFINKITFLRSLLIRIGNNTMAIFVFHFLSFKLVSLIQIWIYGYNINYLGMFPVLSEKKIGWWVVYSCVGIIIPMFYQKIASWIASKISFKVSN